MATTAPASPQDYNLREMLYDLSPDDFEAVVADVYAARGWDTTVTQASQDGGIDVVAHRNDGFGMTALLQAKRYAADNKVGAREVREYAAVRDNHADADMMVVVTTGEFTSSAQREAAEMNVKLIDGADLAGMIAANDLGGRIGRLHPLAGPDAGKWAAQSWTGQPEQAMSQPAGEPAGASQPTGPVPPQFGDGAPVALLATVSLGAVGLYLAPSGPTALSMTCLFIGVLIAPMAVYRDARRLRGQHGDEMPTPAWIIPALLPVVGAMLYTIYRWRTIRRVARSRA
jgi:hypothetical protein